MSQWTNPRIQLFLRTYLDILVAELHALGCDPQKELSAPELEQLRKTLTQALEPPPNPNELEGNSWTRIRCWLFGATPKRQDPITAGEILLLEAAIIQRIKCKHELAMRLLISRELLSSLLSPESYSQIEPYFVQLAKPSLISGEDKEDALSALQGEARAISSRLCRRVGGLPAVEEIRTQVGMNICAWTMLIALVAVLLNFTVFSGPFVLVMGAWGALGAMVSTIERLYKADLLYEPLKMAITLSGGRFALYLSPFLGMIFAMVLYVLFRGELITGFIFPTVECAAAAPPFPRLHGTFLDRGLVRLPTDCAKVSPNAELCKMFLWGFLAGWAERMVPDALNKLAPQASDGVRTLVKTH
jgi:hypothetical protein